VLEALLRRLGVDYRVLGAIPWKSVKKYQARRRNTEPRPEQETLLRLELMAEEKGAEVLVFVRDRDKDQDRENDINEGLTKISKVMVVGGVAIEETEAWILALLGDNKAEKHSRPKEFLEKTRGIASTQQKVEEIEKSDLGKIPARSPSLESWLASAREMLL
jgi:hypothetical protein